MPVTTRRAAANTPLKVEGDSTPLSPVSPSAPRATKAKAPLNPITTHFEFMGPYGLATVFSPFHFTMLLADFVHH